eukprot:1154799-Pelagomonas_calceolata.AAC.8
MGVPHLKKCIRFSFVQTSNRPGAGNGARVCSRGMWKAWAEGAGLLAALCTHKQGPGGGSGARACGSGVGKARAEAAGLLAALCTEAGMMPTCSGLACADQRTARCKDGWLMQGLPAWHDGNWFAGDTHIALLPRFQEQPDTFPSSAFTTTYI